jgi:hypothetical protein
MQSSSLGTKEVCIIPIIKYKGVIALGIEIEALTYN